MLALDFVSTLRAGRSGLTDNLADPGALTAWARSHADDLGLDPGFAATPEQWSQVVELRQAVRALFARAVAPGPPSAADAARLPPFDQALARVNAAALAVPTAPRLAWDEAAPTLTHVPVGPAEQALPARLAQAAMEFLAGPQAAELRACPAPRCVLYFVKEHPRQEWCSTACGNRARAARHYRAHKGE
ncbi:CGNR zinc finger domain-containing protein [Nonomuraea sp. NPDC059194]|uniref:CGNR zinc finger domain-containing protein n=1 Tax=Nonomuraea sp. NPDC059194 TaxID=3346764 RepID=UPI0036824973